MKNRLSNGVKKLSEYGIWNSMRQRCSNPNNNSFRHYGGRGIYVCESWQKSFAAFYSDMGARPSMKHSIDRIDRNGPYIKENCRWATPVEQANNHGNNTIIDIHGEEKTIAEWSRESGIERHVISSRINVLGWDKSRAVTEEIGKKFQIGNRSQTIAQWCRELGVSSDAVYQRINKLGWPAAKAIMAGRATRNRMIEHDGVIATVSEWSKQTGLSQATIRARLRQGWGVGRALSEPVKMRRHVPV